MRRSIKDFSPQAAKNPALLHSASPPTPFRRETFKLKSTGLTCYLSFNEETIFSNVGMYTSACGRYHVKKMKYILLFFTV
jgi:hypothetical protein